MGNIGEWLMSFISMIFGGNQENGQGGGFFESIIGFFANMLGFGGQETASNPQTQETGYSPALYTGGNTASTTVSNQISSVLRAPDGDPATVLVDIGHSGSIQDASGRELSRDELKNISYDQLRHAVASGTLKIVPGAEPGAVSPFDGKTEFEHNVWQAFKVKDHLNAQGVDVEFYISTERAIGKRVDLANQLGVDVFVSIHNNAGGGEGSEIFHGTGQAPGQQLATQINQANANAGLPTRGDKDERLTHHGRLGVFRNHNDPNRPTVLAEGFFMDNQRDNARGNTEEFIDTYSASIANSVTANLISRGYVQDTNVPESYIANLPSPNVPNVANDQSLGLQTSSI